MMSVGSCSHSLFCCHVQSNSTTKFIKIWAAALKITFPFLWGFTQLLAFLSLILPIINNKMENIPICKILKLIFMSDNIQNFRSHFILQPVKPLNYCGLEFFMFEKKKNFFKFSNICLLLKSLILFQNSMFINLLS